MFRAGIGLVLVLFAAAPTHSHKAEPASGSRIHQLFVEDQKDREGKIDWVKVARRDEQRRVEAHQLLSEGAVQSGVEYREAAFIFQHGDKPNDYLLAHVLATVAVAKGDNVARWIFAATLDRYLQKIGQPQVLGTQFSSKDENGPWTQDPYDRVLIPEALRTAMCVPDQTTQKQQLEAMNAGKDWTPPHTCK